MLSGLLVILVILVCVALIGVVLLQRSEGGAFGMGGGPTGLITARGAGDLLTRTTWILFGLFLALCLTLTLLGAHDRATSSLVEKMKSEIANPNALNQPRTPATPPAPSPFVSPPPPATIPAPASAATPAAVVAKPAHGRAAVRVAAPASSALLDIPPPPAQLPMPAAAPSAPAPSAPAPSAPAPSAPAPKADPNAPITTGTP